MGLPWLGAVTALMLAIRAGSLPQDDALYGRVTTTDGEVVEGYLRWDRNEAGRSDFLDGRKEIPIEYIREADPACARRLDHRGGSSKRDDRAAVRWHGRAREHVLGSGPGHEGTRGDPSGRVRAFFPVG
jgi:hypothetical protein